MKLIFVVVISLLLMPDLFAQAQNYRTFSAFDLSETNEVSKDVIGVEGEFVFGNINNEVANGIFVEFSAPVSILRMGSFTNYESQNAGGKDLVFTGGNIPSGGTLDIRVTTLLKHVQVNKWWWVANGKKLGVTHSKLQSILLLNKLAMPNVANVRNDLFFSKTVTLKVGISQPLHRNDFCWVSIKTSFDALNSLIYNGNFHYGQPRGFSRMGNGSLLHGQLKCLTPAMLNNKIFAELLALKFNILASEAGITPGGFGDLYINEAWSPYVGRTVKQIADHADSLMTFWRGVMKSEYAYLDQIISQINTSFIGPMDTISYCTSMLIKGVTSSATNLLSITKPLMTPSAQSEVLAITPLTSELGQNYPNPCNPVTEIRYSISAPSAVSLVVYDMLGEEMTTLVDERKEPGMYQALWNASEVPSGVYMYRLTAGAFSETKRMMVLK